jgi:hypothetical protein
MGHDHCHCSEETERIEERFVKGLERMRIWEFGHAAETGAVYQDAEDYDPVLKSHCGIVSEPHRDS